MLKIDSRQQAMLKEMGIRLPWSPAETISVLPATRNAYSSPEQLHVSTKNPALDHQPIQTIRTQLADLKVHTHTTLNNTRHKINPTPNTYAGNSTTDHITQVQSSESRIQQIARMNWQELEESAQACQACSLCQSRKQSVFCAGNPQAQWMIVGEAPGEQEDKQGEPFVGLAGQLLDRMLHQLDLSRKPIEQQQPVYIANVLKCRPPRNRNPAPEEIALCECYLKRQIELVQPKIILIMGRFAVQTLLNTTDAIGRLRGKIHYYQNIPAIVTYHPAYLLRTPVDKRKSWEDLCLAAQTFKATNP